MKIVEFGDLCSCLPLNHGASCLGERCKGNQDHSTVRSNKVIMHVWWKLILLYIFMHFQNLDRKFYSLGLECQFFNFKYYSMEDLTLYLAARITCTSISTWTVNQHMLFSSFDSDWMRFIKLELSEWAWEGSHSFFSFFFFTCKLQ